MARAQTVHGNGVWAGARGEAELTRAARLDATQELRLLGGDFKQTFTELGLRYRPRSGFWRVFRVAARYRYILRSDETRHRGAGDVEAQVPVGKARLSYRLRLQATARAQDTQTEVRNRLRVSLDLPRRLSPYVAVELFHQLSPNSEYREFRVYLGVEWEISRGLELGAFYLRQEEANVRQPEANDILGVGLSYRFREVKPARKQ